MTIRLFRFLLISFPLFILIVSCSKINQATELGDDVIPGVDGVTTFDTTLSVITFNDTMDRVKDSALVLRSEDHILGNISNDPFFGKTNAKIFVQLEPSFYKWNFRGVYDKDSLHLDSVVLVLGWKGTYGDTSSPQRVRVYEIDQSNDFRRDSFYLLRDQFVTYSNLLGSKDFFPQNLKDSVKAFQDSTVGQLRVKLNNSFGDRLLKVFDTTNAYVSDSAFKANFKGFAIDADPNFGNALMSFGIVGDANTKLAIYYHYDKNGASDTVVDYFTATGASTVHNYIERFKFAGTPLAAASGGVADDILYLINTPGSFATIKIPAINTLDNRIIHRAELIVEQLYDVSDDKFGPPQGLMLDVYDSTLGDYKFMPFDFFPDQTGASAVSYGIYGKRTVDGNGNPIKVWKFNITRYVQNILTQKEPLHDFRLLAAQKVTERLKVAYVTNTGGYYYYSEPVNSQYAFGRVRVGGGNHPTQRMRLRIIYTKI